MDINKIYNEDCLTTMNKMYKSGVEVDVILTSPPYNTSRIGRKDKYSTRYDGFQDNKTNDEYIDWSVGLFNKYDNVLKTNGCVIYNISYSSENTDLLWRVIGNIVDKTNFTTADCIVWKKKSALPNNVSKNKLTRIVEFVFIFCRKNELNTFNTNKQIKSTNSRTNQHYYENIFNFIEAPNNDGKCDLNRATYSTELCEKLLNIYAQTNSLIYDSFMGTGTTACASIKLKHSYIGSEISKTQCKYAEERIKQLN